MAVGVVLGAGVTFAYVGSGGPSAAAPRLADQHRTTVAEPPPAKRPAPSPAPKPILPFNAKLTSRNIPTPDGGVRHGACSGALIAPRWVATAGHCFHDADDERISGKPPYTMTVTVGRLKDSDPGGHVATVVDVRQSPVNDLAVARLSSAADGVDPLTVADTPPTVGEQLRFAGWGSLSATDLGPSSRIKRGRFTVADVNETTLETESVIPKTVRNTPCPEDSGAPFFTSDDDRTGQLVAVVNTGPPCPQPGPEILARVDVVATWIHQQIGSA